MITFERWKKLMSALGFSENRNTYEVLIQHHTEKHRAYHNTKHVADCLEKLDSIPGEIALRNEIELALWFHDIVYKPYGSNNELKSARFAMDFLTKAGGDEAVKTSIFDLILATKHTQLPLSEAEKIITDIDLSILGADAEAYGEYARNIRKEYLLVPGPLYRKRRKEILKRFLDRKPLFQTHFFRDKYERQARINLRDELKQYA